MKDLHLPVGDEKLHEDGIKIIKDLQIVIRASAPM